jgi:hypothetical protein
MVYSNFPTPVPISKTWDQKCIGLKCTMDKKINKKAFIIQTLLDLYYKSCNFSTIFFIL